MENQIMRLVYYKTIGGQEYLMNTFTSPGDQGARVLQTVKPGNKFWGWLSLPSGQGSIIDVDQDWGTFSWGTGAPTCASTASANNLILAELASVGPLPEDVLTWSNPPA